MEALKKASEILRNQRAFHPSLEQIEEMIEGLSEEDWSALLEWMEDQLEDHDPESQPGGGWY